MMSITIEHKQFEDLSSEEKYYIGRLGRRDGLLLRTYKYYRDCYKHGQKIESHHIVVAYDDGRPVGWSLLCPSFSADINYEMMIYVQHKYRGKGIGRQLTEAIKTYFKGKVKIWLEGDHHQFYSRVGLVKEESYKSIKYFDSVAKVLVYN